MLAPIGGRWDGLPRHAHRRPRIARAGRSRARRGDGTTASSRRGAPGRGVTRTSSSPRVDWMKAHNSLSAPRRVWRRRHKSLCSPERVWRPFVRHGDGGPWSATGHPHHCPQPPNASTLNSSHAPCVVPCRITPRRSRRHPRGGEHLLASLLNQARNPCCGMLDAMPREHVRGGAAPDRTAPRPGSRRRESSAAPPRRCPVRPIPSPVGTVPRRSRR